MNIQLIQGEFSASDALELITQMARIKIKYHEDKVTSESSAEDIKYRESKIKILQNELSKLRAFTHSAGSNVKLEATICIE